jgi:predicted hydrocarbon binding protein
MNNLESISDVIAKKHPDIMSSVKEFSNSLPNDENKPLIMHDLGVETGKKIFLAKYKSQKLDDTIGLALKKVVLPTVSPFALAKIKENELHVTMCPFCIHIKEAVDTVQCDFLTGLICGLISPIFPVSVVEVQCRARKESACVFLVNRKY